MQRWRLSVINEWITKAKVVDAAGSALPTGTVPETQLLQLRFMKSRIDISPSKHESRGKSSWVVQSNLIVPTASFLVQHRIYRTWSALKTERKRKQQSFQPYSQVPFSRPSSLPNTTPNRASDERTSLSWWPFMSTAFETVATLRSMLRATMRNHDRLCPKSKRKEDAVVG